MNGFKMGFVICVWFLFMLGSCFCRFVVVNNSLEVISPKNLKATYEYAIDSSSFPRCEGPLSGDVVYPKVNQKACKSFIDDFSWTTKTSGGSNPAFLLADRGDCYFTLKALNAQNAGAVAILVADDRHESLFTMDFPEDEGAPVNYLENITIPLAFISQSFGISLKKRLYENEVVSINLDWSEALLHSDM
ncbi:vacuolar-sorting receptor 2-like [Cynara cardunculus var. scolymus]|uniref:vacuolar-sorting receptor 2-like n=1 Tax=Cynara cardunculus var. scolymus TaxID=59895 RepID=UPI000D627521|nr:vacuolar-sorting receptor 2-like [Cynara cardunculus var. scolymus]